MRTRALLLAILALGAGLRIWGMGYGLPQPHARPDEDKILGPALAIAGDGDWHPRQFTYPSLPTYLDTLAVLGARAAGRLALDGSMRDYVEALGLVRGLAVLLGVLTLAASFALGSAAYGRDVGLLAALAASTNLLHVLYSRFVTVDTLTTLFATLALFFAVRAGREQRRRDYLLAGVLAGLTASCKFNLGIVGLALAPAPLVGGRGELPRRTGWLALAALLAFLAFALTSPYCVLRWQAVVRELRATSGILYAGGGELALFVHLRSTLPEGFGWPAYLMAVLGVLRALWLRRPADLALLGFVVPLFAMAASVHTVFPRYLVPLVPPLAVLAAEALLAALPASRVLRPAAAVLLVAPSLWSCIQLDRLLAGDDTRVLAAAWVRANVLPRAGVVTCKGYGNPVLDHPRALETYCGMKRVAEGFPGYRYLITQEHPDFTLTGVRPDVLESLGRSSTPVVEFSPFRPRTATTPHFYRDDAFFVPLSGFAALERAGPVLKVWDLARVRGEPLRNDR